MTQSLDVLHRQERPVVAAGGLDGSRYHSGKGFAKFGKLRYECLDHGRVFLKRERVIRYIGGLILYYHVKIVVHGQRKDIGQMIDLAPGAHTRSSLGPS